MHCLYTGDGEKGFRGEVVGGWSVQDSRGGGFRTTVWGSLRSYRATRAWGCFYCEFQAQRPRSGSGGSSGAGLAEALDELVVWVGARSFHSQVRLVAGVKRQDVINNGL